MVNLVTDTFDESGGNVNLTDHTTNTGQSWVNRINASSSVARVVDADDNTGVNSNDDSAGLLYTVDVATDAEQDVTVTIDRIATGAQDAVGAVARYVDANNYLVLGFLGAVATNDVKVIQITGGIPNVVGTDSTAVAVGDTFKIEIRGETAEVFKNGSGTPLITVLQDITDTAGQAGLQWGNTSGTSSHDVDSDWRLDDFIVDHFPAGGQVTTRRYYDMMSA